MRVLFFAPSNYMSSPTGILLRRALTLDAHHEVSIANDLDMANLIIEDNDIEVVITSEVHPGFDSVKFLQGLRRRHETMVLVLLCKTVTEALVKNAHPLNIKTIPDILWERELRKIKLLPQLPTGPAPVRARP